MVLHRPKTDKISWDFSPTTSRYVSGHKRTSGYFNRLYFSEVFSVLWETDQNLTNAEVHSVLRRLTFCFCSKHGSHWWCAGWDVNLCIKWLWMANATSYFERLKIPQDFKQLSRVASSRVHCSHKIFCRGCTRRRSCSDGHWLVLDRGWTSGLAFHFPPFRMATCSIDLCAAAATVHAFLVKSHWREHSSS
jgi:hypothetical protein